MKAYRLAVLSAVALASFPLAALSACGSSSPSPDTAGDDDDDASMSSFEAGGGNGDGSVNGDSEIKTVPVPDSSTDASTGMDVAVDAAPPEASIPEPDAGACDPNEMVDSTQVFVSTGPGSAASGACNSRTPCTTLGAALSAATAGGATTVYIDEGSYTESVTIPKGIKRLRGGWNYAGGQWTIDCSQARLQATKISAPGNANMTIIASDLGGTTSLETLAIASKGSAGTGETLYGVFATGPTTTLTLIDTSVVTAAGGPGAGGTAGSPGAAAPASCTPGSNPAATATAGTAGSAGTLTMYSAAGAATSTAGTGAAGGYGGNGATPAQNCEVVPSCVRNVNPPNPPTCSCDGTGTLCAPVGTGGCGGGPGSPGTGGAGGGSSIALYTFDANVTVTGGSLQAGNGGAGGPGGQGSTGGPASAGAGTTKAYTACDPPVAYVTGPAGNAGAIGAAGPSGGGGAGGDSFGYYYSGGTVLVTTPGVGHGAGGAGGSGANAGPTGAAADHN